MKGPNDQRQLQLLIPAGISLFPGAKIRRSTGFSREHGAAAGRHGNWQRDYNPLICPGIAGLVAMHPPVSHYFPNQENNS
jgi:hypothetical protein